MQNVKTSKDYRVTYRSVIIQDWNQFAIKTIAMMISICTSYDSTKKPNHNTTAGGTRSVITVVYFFSKVPLANFSLPGCTAALVRPTSLWNSQANI